MLNAFNHPWTYYLNYVFPLPALVSLVLSHFLMEHVTGQIRLLLLVAPSWMKAHWISTVLGMLEDIPHECPIIKDMDVLVGWLLYGLHFLLLTLWLLRNVLCK